MSDILVVSNWIYKVHSFLIMIISSASKLC